jgi:outer membrane protein assembly factor BamB
VQNSGAAPTAAASSSSVSQQWKFEFPGRLAETPTKIGRILCADGLVHIPLFDERHSGLGEHRIKTFDLRSGQKRWERTLARSNGGSPPDVAVGGEVLYTTVSSGSENNVMALNTVDGSTRWSLTASWAHLVGRYFYATDDPGTNDAILKAFNPRGKRLCHEQVAPSITHRPALVDSSLIYSATNGKVVSIPQQGTEANWEVAPGGTINTPPVANRGRVFVTTDDGRIFAIRADTGHDLWNNSIDITDRLESSQEVKSSRRVAAATKSAVILHRDRHRRLSDAIAAYHPESGAKLWEEHPPDEKMISISQPVAAGQTLYFTSMPYNGRTSRLRLYDATSGTERERHRLPGRTIWPPTVADGRIIVITDEALHVFA